MNLHSTRNSAEKNRKWPKLAMLATAAVLLSAIAFIGAGAIPQPQQAFAQAANVTQSNAQTALNIQAASNTANVEADDASVTQSNTQSAANVQIASNAANVTGP